MLLRTAAPGREILAVSLAEEGTPQAKKYILKKYRKTDTNRARNERRRCALSKLKPEIKTYNFTAKEKSSFTATLNC